MSLPLVWGHHHALLEGPRGLSAAVAGALGAVMVVQVLWFLGLVPRRFLFTRDDDDHTP